jgi:hypothetical protein
MMVGIVYREWKEGKRNRNMGRERFHIKIWIKLLVILWRGREKERIGNKRLLKFRGMLVILNRIKERKVIRIIIIIILNHLSKMQLINLISSSHISIILVSLLLKQLNTFISIPRILWSILGCFRITRFWRAWIGISIWSINFEVSSILWFWVGGGNLSMWMIFRIIGINCMGIEGVMWSRMRWIKFVLIYIINF